MERFAIVESFYTIQGEGLHAGRAAYFIRLGGCDVGCSWCDAKESWMAGRYELLTVQSIVDGAKESGAERVVITGGEPLMHNLDPLTAALREAGFELFMESSGSHPMSGEFDWITLSPKRRKEPLEQVYGLADELKVVICSQEDFEWAESCANKVREGCALLLQPEWSVRESIMPQIVEFAKRNPKWRVSLQTHKYMNVP